MVASFVSTFRFFLTALRSLFEIPSSSTSLAFILPSTTGDTVLSPDFGFFFLSFFLTLVSCILASSSPLAGGDAEGGSWVTEVGSEAGRDPYNTGNEEEGEGS